MYCTIKKPLQTLKRIKLIRLKIKRVHRTLGLVTLGLTGLDQWVSYEALALNSLVKKKSWRYARYLIISNNYAN